MDYSVLLVGWDVGPWKCSGESEDALIVVGWDGNRLTVIEESGFHGNLFAKMRGKVDLAALLGVAGWTGPCDGLKVVVAVDAVFGWPRRFVELASGKSNYTPKIGNEEKNSDNRFLYRETERFIIDALKLKSPNLPKTAAGDAIGSAATKAQFVLSCLRKQEDIYVPPLDPWEKGRAKDSQVTIIEVYPGVTKFSAAFENIDLPQGTKMRLLGKSDPNDALRCAMVAACYAKMTGFILFNLPALYLPTDATTKEGYDVEAIPTEGWIFTPKKV
jgi:hypothetical protein